jgi:hypothetical protein
MDACGTFDFHKVKQTIEAGRIDTNSALTSLRI